MRNAVVVAGSLFLLAFAGCLGDDEPTENNEAPSEPWVAEIAGKETPIPGREGGPGDVVVVAVLDFQFNPYHWDFLAEHMPQHQDEDPANDLPLDQAPHTWLPGFPNPEEAFAGYQSLNLTLTPDDPDAHARCIPRDATATSSEVVCPEGDDLYTQDESEWAKVNRSSAGETYYHYIPGTKVVGFVNFQGNNGFGDYTHGGGSSSVSVGNLFGSCPNCLLVFVNLGGASEEWARNQDWIDVTTHSYEGSTVGTGFTRDNRQDCDTEPLRLAVERGQQIFWAAGNGLANTFTAPQTTIVNCKKAPEWTVTVGAISPDDDSYTGHAKPVHIANLGSQYPRHGGGNVTSSGTFGGTSNATPVTAGMYAQALYELRTRMEGPTRMQDDGVIAMGEPGCGDASAGCALDDGVLTVHELREALFRAAAHTDGDYQVGLTGTDTPESSNPQEQEYLTEGHGSLHGTMADTPGVETQRIVDFVTGDWHEEIDPDLHDWMVAYSWCVQQAWGTWGHGYWQEEMPLPEQDPEWPFRSWMASDACPESAARNPA